MPNESKKKSGLMEVGSMLPGLRHPAYVWVIGLSLLVAIAVTGCGGGGKTNAAPATPAITIALGTTPSSLTVGQTYQFSATVSNTSNTAVTWAAGGVAGGNSTVGTISSSGLYTAPTMVPAPQSVNITATSQADSAKSVSAAVTINISFTMDENSASMLVAATHQFTATIAGTTNTAVTWTVNGLTGGNATVGTISEAGLYTAPQVPPSPSTVTVTATSAAYTSTSCSIAVTVLPPPLTVSVNPSALDLQENGTVQLTDTVTTTGNLPFSTAVTWGVKSPGNTGIAKYGYISSTGLYTAPATPPAGALNPIPIYVVSQEDPTKFAISYVTVTKTPVLLTISTTTLANGVANNPYSATISAFGGAQPYVWSVPPNTLPPGLSVNSSTGVISGTPTTAGTFPFAVTVTDQTSPTPETQTANLSITIIPQLSISTVSLPTGSVGAGYSATLTETGGVGPFTWSITSGTLPSGLTLTGNTISGTPATGTGSTTGQSYPLTITVTDSGSPQQTKTFSSTLIIYNGVVITTSSPINTAFAGQPYTFSVQAAGGAAPYTWLYTNLPSWLSVTPSTGLTSTIAGTPANPAAAATFNVKVTDANGVHYSLDLGIAVSPVFTFSKPTLPSATVNQAYTTTFTASGGTAPYAWSYTGLPSWLTATPSTTLSSTLAGTPTTAGTFGFTAKLTDSSAPPQTQSWNLSSTVYLELTITTTSLTSGTVNSAYSATLQSSGGTGTVTWAISAGTLPAGLQLSGAVISGTPTAPGTSNFTVQATDSASPPKVKTQVLSITINPVLSISTTSLPGGTVGVSYSQTVAASGGTLPVTWSVTSGSLPTGLSIQSTAAASGTISGTPTASGTYNFTATAKDSSHPAVTINQALSISIANPPLAIITTSLPNGVVGTAYSAPLQASGGTSPYTWSVASGSSLPTWLSISGSGTSWTIGGTPTTAATSGFTLQVSDSSNPVQTQTQPLSVTVVAHSDACGTGNEPALKGQYAFSLIGYTADGFAGVIGSFTADGNGNITAGHVDGNAAQVAGNGMGVQSAAVTPSGSSYTMGSDNRGCATIVTPFYTFNTRFAIPPSANGNAQGTIQEYEAAPAYYYATGQMFQQKIPASVPTGTWVYRQVGTYYGARLVVAGTKTVGSGGAVTGGEYDSVVEGAVHTYTGITGTSTTPDPTTGRYTVTTTLSGISLTRAAYLISNTQELELTITGANTTILAGYCQLQGGSLTLSGHLVTYGEGAYTAQFATYSVSGTTFTGTVYENIQGTWEVPATPTCSYTIDSYGRVATSGASCGTYYANSTWSYPPVFYLSGPNTGFVVGKDSTLGQLVPQTATTITAGNYYFGTEEAMVMTGTGWGTITGVATFTSTTMTGMEDSSGYGGNEAISDTLTVNSDGTFSTSASPGVIMGLVISPSQIIEVNDPTKVWTTITVFNAAP